MNRCKKLKCGLALSKENTPNWSGFMEMSTQEKTDYEVSKVLIQPFLDLPSSSLNSIYSVLMYASTKTQQIGMKTCFLTFDQPLYAKAVKMVSSAVTWPHYLQHLVLQDNILLGYIIRYMN